ncbi:MAG: GNAT family N-acetyltransferase [Alteraurantiacibacter sp.]|nr:GNAT family N-acetyltransferase [Alteraurantiacibacter sp.]
MAAVVPLDAARVSVSAPPATDGCQLRARNWHECSTPAFVARWDELARHASGPNPFYESWYLLPSLHALDRHGQVKLLCLEHSGRLLGLMPMHRARSYYGYPLPHWQNWVHNNCFCGLPLVAAGEERAFWQALLEWCDSHAGSALFLHLAQMPAHGALNDGLHAALAGKDRPAATVLSEERAMLSTNLAPHAYLEASLSGKKRKELRRQQRRLAEAGYLRVERLRSEEGLSDWIARFLALEASGWKGTAGSSLAANPATAALFRESLEGAAARGRLERLSLLLDEEPVAMLATFLTPPGAYSYKTAFDERFARYSPGVLLQCAALDVIADPSIDWVDSCARPDHSMIDHLWRERRAMASHSIAIGGRLRRQLFVLLARLETGASPRGIA